MDDQTFRPCHGRYHVQCFRVGEPFRSRRSKSQGLHFPAVHSWPNFICEACTVRAVIGRELFGRYDPQLLALERMRILDMAHYWAQGTHRGYQSKIRIIQQFERQFDFRVLRPTQLASPPHGPEIPLMWCQEAYSLRPAASRRQNSTGNKTVSFGTVRALRSAVSQFYTWDYMVAHPSTTMDGTSNRVLVQDCRPTDTLAFTLHARGMSSRIGADSVPATPLLDRHVRTLDSELNRQYLDATDPTLKRELALAGLANLILWLGWLRSAEALGLEWEDIDVITPDNGPSVDLPWGIGAISLRLQPETKTNRTTQADVHMAYTTASGYHLGTWFHRASSCSARAHGGRDHSRIFQHADGSPWTSLYYREVFLYPHLRRLQSAGDPYLRPFTGGAGNSLEDKFWSLHCYRRGARTHVSKRVALGGLRLRKATREHI